VYFFGVGIAGVSSLLCGFILIKLLKSGQVTNFVVIHTIWVIFLFWTINISVALTEVLDLCLTWYVKLK
jgi:hypothetical protein